MSDALAVALVGMVGNIIMIGMQLHARSKQKQIHDLVNGLAQKREDAAEDKGHAEGVKDEKENPS